jgi:catechol 2,3-dioxygenase-like lactoylglutathione lyase family enzyme
MKRFHVSLSVADVEKSTQFYTALFDTEPTLRKDDYAKWMLDDPRLNFSVSSVTEGTGVDHIGLQADTMEELEIIQERLAAAELETFEQPDTECCYARSSKTWIRDPDDVAWETFVTHGAITHYGSGGEEQVETKMVQQDPEARCCASHPAERNVAVSGSRNSCCAA